MFNFTPLLGAHADSPASQSLLELDGGVKILIDVGWDEVFDTTKLQALERHLSTISIVLLTHPTLDHLGAYAHCCKHIPQFTKIPVYATTPVISLGRTLLQDLYSSNPLAASIIPPSSLADVVYSSSLVERSPNILLQPPTTEEIASYFSLINPLKYSQPHQPIPSPFSPPLDGLTITAYNAGHTLGGTIWHIQYGLESIVYAVDWNQAKENILSGAAWLGGGGGGAEIIEQLRRPTALVCSSKGVEKSHLTGGRKRRDETLLNRVAETVLNGGTVLIPTDSSARILELAYILEQHWREETAGANGDAYRNARVHLASKSAGSTLRFAKSMIEWMDEGIVRDMEAANDKEKAASGGKAQGDQTPLDFRHIKLIERKTQLERALSSGKPGVILASDKSLEWGFSSGAMRKLCTESKNLVILTERGIPSNAARNGRVGIGSTLWEMWQKWAENEGANSETNIFSPNGATVVSHDAEVARLQGEENLFYQQYLARRRQVHSTEEGDNTMPGETAAGIADDESETTDDSDEGSEGDQQGRALNVTATMTQSRRKVGLTDEELGVNVLLRRKNIYDYDVRGKRGREKIFPFTTKRNKNDDFGDIIRPEEYLRAEEKDEVDSQGVKEEANGEAAVGQKRKWGDVAQRQTKGGNKRTKMDGEDAAERLGTGDDGNASESEESDYEPEESTPEGPLKAIFREESLAFHMRIAYIDFSGLHEKRDLQMLIPLIRPRKLILIAGDAEDTNSLAEDCRTLLDAGDESNIVFAPTIGETVNASVDTNAWELKLSRELVKHLSWQNVKGLGIVAITGRLDTILAKAAENSADETRRKKLKMFQGDETIDAGDLSSETSGKLEPVLDILPTSTMPANQLVTQPIHVGDLRLADLRRLMQASGHMAEFRGEGTLLIDDMVIVRKTASGTIEVVGGSYSTPGARGRQHEGTFFAVKRRIYEGLAVVAGG